MTGRDECRLRGCANEPRGAGAKDPFAGGFCSARCEVKFDHLREDARDAARADRC